MNKTIKFLINKKDSGKRIDIFLSERISYLTRSYLKKLIESKNLIINEKIISSPSTKVRTNDKIIIYLVKRQEEKLIAKKINLNIVYEDKDLLIVDKPKGMTVHPGAGNYDNTLANALVYKYKNSLSNINGNLRPGIVHRIDKDTSGLLVVAKNNLSHSELGKQFANHTIKRKYQCLTWGVIRPFHGRIETLITRDKKNRQKMTTSEIIGKKAITNYKTIKIFNNKDVPKISLIECELETGRTHQIRVHLKYKGTSILGDYKYGKKNVTYKKINNVFYELLRKTKGQVLHAQSIEFKHPTKKKWMNFKTNMPEDFKKILNFLDNVAG